MPAAWLVEVVMAEVVMVLVALALEVAAVAGYGMTYDGTVLP